MKLIFIFFISLQISTVFANGFCNHNKGQAIHQEFCSAIIESECRAHSHICTWNKVDDTADRMYKPPGYCQQKRNLYTPEVLCNEYDETLCRVHHLFCEWKNKGRQ